MDGVILYIQNNVHTFIYVKWLFALLEIPKTTTSILKKNIYELFSFRLIDEYTGHINTFFFLNNSIESYIESRKICLHL